MDLEGVKSFSYDLDIEDHAPVVSQHTLFESRRSEQLNNVSDVSKQTHKLTGWLTSLGSSAFISDRTTSMLHLIFSV